MARGRRIQPASPRPVAVWRAERIVASVLVKDVNSDLEQLWVALFICRKALPLAAMRCMIENLGVSRGVWDCIVGERDGETKEEAMLVEQESSQGPQSY